MIWKRSHLEYKKNQSMKEFKTLRLITEELEALS